MLGKCCYNCKHYFEDRSVGAADCMMADDDRMTDDEFEKYFVEDQEGCPHWEEIEYEEYPYEEMEA